MLRCWIFLTFFRPSYEIELVFRHEACRNQGFFYIYTDLFWNGKQEESGWTATEKRACQRVQRAILVRKNDGWNPQRWRECRERVKGDSLMGGEGESGEIEFDVHFTLVSLHLLRRVPVCGSLLSCEWFEWLFSAVCTWSWKARASREVGERKWLTWVWSFRFLAVWTVVDSDVLLAQG